MKMADRGHRQLVREIDVTGAIVRHGFGPAAGQKMAVAAVERAPGSKLFIKECDVALDGAAADVQPLAQVFRTRSFGVGFLCRMRANAMRLEFYIHGWVRLIGAVTQERALESRVQQRIQAIDIVLVARHVLHIGHKTLRRNDQVFTHAVEIAVLGCAVPCARQAAEAFLARRPHQRADVDGMGVDDEKGGWPSPPNAQNACVSRWSSGVSRARRSANFCREGKWGKSARMVALTASQSK